MQVKEIMATAVATGSFDGRLNDVAQIMWDRDLGSVPIVDGEGRLAGIITDRDVCMAAYTQGHALHEIPVARVMATHVLVCHIDDSVDTAEQLMREGQVRRVPVIDNDGRPVGVVSLSDLARAAAHLRGVRAPHVVETLTAVSERRHVLTEAASPASA